MKIKSKYIFLSLVFGFLIISLSLKLFNKTRAPILNNKSRHHKIGNPVVVKQELSTNQVQNKIVNLKIEHFKDIERRIFNSLPGKSILAASAHGPHIAFFDLTTALGDLRDSWENDPELYNVALGFYQKCLSNSKLMTSMRALCLNNIQLISKRINFEFNDSEVNNIEEIKKLVKRLNQS